jgi:hypothetical protein
MRGTVAAIRHLEQAVLGAPWTEGIVLRYGGFYGPGTSSAPDEQRFEMVRRHTGWGPRLLAGVTGHPHSTVWKVLHRHGLSRHPPEPREAANRYEWPCPGDLLHIDVETYSRFEKPGHALTGDHTRVDKQGRKHHRPGLRSRSRR